MWEINRLNGSTHAFNLAYQPFLSSFGHKTRNILVSSYHNCVCEFLECLNGLLNAVDLSVHSTSEADILSFRHTHTHTSPFALFSIFAKWNKLAGITWDQCEWIIRKFVANLISWIILIGFVRCSFRYSLHLLLACETREDAQQSKKKHIKNNFTFCWKTN